MSKHNKTSDGFKPVLRKAGSENQHNRFPHFIIKSPEFKSLSYASKMVMQCMQMNHWPGKYTSYGFKQAMRDTGFGGNATITKAFNELQSKGFIVLRANYNHIEAKTRLWELTWMSYHGKKPQDLWRDVT